MTLDEIEICCGSINSAANARLGGARRIELCQALSEGGTTPSHATIRTAVEDLRLDVFVLVRPRGGNFVYNQMEIKTMEEDVRQCKKLGVKGIVTGFLTEEGNIDKELTRRFVELAAQLPVTFHRAFDECRNPEEALEDIIACGCRRLLTSGCRPTAQEGAEIIGRLAAQAGGRIAIMAGSGVNHSNAKLLKELTNAHEIHASCKRPSSCGTEETDPEEVRQLLEILVR